MEEGPHTRSPEPDPGPVADPGPDWESDLMADPNPETGPAGDAVDAEPEADAGAGPEGDPPAEDLASPELAALYIQQGEYERGIGMYRTLLDSDPENRALKDALDDAEALADLLILRPPKAQYQAGFDEGYRHGMARRGALTGDERIARLTAWLDRVKERTHAH